MSLSFFFNNQSACLSFKKALRLIQMTLFVLFTNSATAYSQDNSLNIQQYYDSNDTQSHWIAYSPKDVNAYSFWHAEQNGMIVNWILPEGYSLGEIRLPPISERGDPAAPTFFYQGDHQIYQQILIPADDKDISLPLTEEPIGLSLTYGDCSEQCITKSGHADFTLTTAQNPLSGAETIQIRKSGSNIRADGKVFHIAIHKAYNDDGRVDRAFFLPLDATLFDETAPQRLEHFKETGFFSTFALNKELANNARVGGILILDKPTEGGLQSFSIAPKNDFGRATDGMMKRIATDQPMPTSYTSYITAILLALIGGLILNVMPCVFPILALKVYSIIKSGGSDEKDVRRDALSYSAGIIVSFAILAAILIAMRSAGEGVGWGYQLQTPAFVLSMAILFFVIGLNFLGFFEIPSFLADTGHGLTQKKGSKGSFFTGVLATLVAAPCTAPFMVTAVAFALAQSSIKAISVFMALGLGLSLPYLIIGFIPASRLYFPKPGQWIVTFKSFLAFPMFAAMVWMIWILSIQTGPTGVLIVLSVMVAIGFSVWIAQSADSGKKSLITVITILAVSYSVVSVKPLRGAMSRTTDQQMATLQDKMIGDMPVIPFSHDKLAELRREGKHVFLHYWAAWCMVCLLHENIVFSRDNFQTFLRDNNIVFMMADRTKDDPDLLMFMEATYGRSSQPIDVFYVSNMDVKPVVFPSVFTASRAIDLMKKQLEPAAEQ